METAYKSNNRPGKFRKKTRIYWENSGRIDQLYLEGNVIPTPGKLRHRLGTLSSEERVINFGDIFFPQKECVTFKIKNSSAENVKIAVISKPSYIDFSFGDQNIAAGKLDSITVCFDTKKRVLFGNTNDLIRFNFEDQAGVTTGYLQVRANVKQDFSQLTPEQLQKAPQIVFQNKKADFGKIEIGQVGKVEFHFENRGKKPLRIHNVQLNNPRVKLVSFDSLLVSGKQGKIHLQTNPKKINTIRTEIDVISNDPQNSIIKLQVNGLVIFPPKKRSTVFLSKNISLEQGQELYNEYLENGRLFILDVRSDSEFAEGHLPKAKNIDVQKKKFKHIIDLLDRKKIYLVYCQKGIRSAKAAEIMRELDFEEVYNLEDGFYGWQKMELPIEK